MEYVMILMVGPIIGTLACFVWRAIASGIEVRRFDCLCQLLSQKNKKGETP